MSLILRASEPSTGPRRTAHDQVRACLLLQLRPPLPRAFGREVCQVPYLVSGPINDLLVNFWVERLSHTLLIFLVPTPSGPKTSSVSPGLPPRRSRRHRRPSLDPHLTQPCQDWTLVSLFRVWRRPVPPPPHPTSPPISSALSNGLSTPRLPSPAPPPGPPPLFHPSKHPTLSSRMSPRSRGLCSRRPRNSSARLSETSVSSRLSGAFRLELEKMLWG